MALSHRRHPSTPAQPSELGRMLSMKSAISTTASLAEKQQAAAEFVKYTLERIGAGTCGVILSQPGSNVVFKMAKHNTTALTGDILNDFKMHSVIRAAMNTMEGKEGFPRIPFLQAYIPRADQGWWDKHTDLSAAAEVQNVDTPCRTICMERIMPLPLGIRSQLINKYCPEHLRDHAHNNSSNKDCLVRVYLGSRRRPPNARTMMFSLRNYNLHLDQMLELGMDVEAFARVMAGALAVIHWQTRIDAKDVEFVLASSPMPVAPELKLGPAQLDDMTGDTYIGPASFASLNWRHRVVDLWLLDFNLCSAITMDESGVDMAARAWRMNDPYYPKPLSDNTGDGALWNAFVTRYIEVSDGILAAEPSLAELPRKFIARIMEIQRDRMAKRA